jgi:phospholipase A1
MKKILLYAIISLSAFSNELDELYTKAQELEINGQYKKSMLLYKQIANKERTVNRSYIDEDKKKEVQGTKKILNTIEDKQTVETIEQMLASSFELYPYHENYLLPFSYDTKKRSDREQFETKFQLSVKKPISHNLFGFNETINFGYTHTSWWQIYDKSSPFRETNYKPEFFVTVPYGKSNITSLKGFKLGFLHESNGQKEEKSRSWNRIYLKSYFQAGNLFVIPKIWYRVPEKEEEDDNSNIHDYLGYGNLTLIYPYKRHTFKLLLRNNLKLDNDNKGFIEVDWTFPFFNSKNTFGYVQLSNGYGDSLIDYDKEINRISFGISLSR